LTDELVCDIAYEFQEAVVEVLSKKLIQAGEHFGAKALALAGGVSANTRLCNAIPELLSKKQLACPFFIPVKKVYSTDNGAMIGLAGLLTKMEV
jgi:probable O-sialoglycoprotein endopeptidase